MLEPARAYACSGPEAMAVIDANQRFGWIMFAIAAAILAASALLPEFRRDGLRSMWPLLVLLVLHPGLWMSAAMGDCGHMRRLGSTGMTVLMPVLVLLAYLWLRRRRRIAEDPARL